MSFADEAAAIERRLADHWGATTPIVWPNVAGPPETAAPAPWLRLSLRTGSTRVVALGPAPVMRRENEITLAIHVPAGIGLGGLRALADQAAAIFENRSFDGIVCGAARLGAAETEAAWCRAELAIPYRRDVTS
jgi:hypothetical protein